VEFDEYDGDEDGFLSEVEFEASTLFGLGVDFSSIDQDDDGLVCLEEVNEALEGTEIPVTDDKILEYASEASGLVEQLRFYAFLCHVVILPCFSSVRPSYSAVYSAVEVEWEKIESVIEYLSASRNVLSKAVEALNLTMIG
jgi:hypothetical protein